MLCIRVRFSVSARNVQTKAEKNFNKYMDNGTVFVINRLVQA